MGKQRNRKVEGLPGSKEHEAGGVKTWRREIYSKSKQCNKMFWNHRFDHTHDHKTFHFTKATFIKFILKISSIELSSICKGAHLNDEDGNKYHSWVKDEWDKDDMINLPTLHDLMYQYYICTFYITTKWLGAYDCESWRCDIWPDTWVAGR